MNRFAFIPRSLFPSVSAAALLCAVALAGGPALAESRFLAMQPGATGTLPQVHAEASETGTRVTLEIPGLEVEDYELDGTIYQTVAFDACELHGEEGAPALPAFTRFVTLPAGSGASLRVLATDEQTLSGYRILPMQPEKGAAFRMDDDLYARDEDLGGEMVEIGAPQILRGWRVVPVTWRPLKYNPARSELRVTRRLEVAIDFVGADQRNDLRRALPPSAAFQDLASSVVLDLPREGSEPGRDHLGTWLIISRNSSSVLAELAPLVAWRQRQGYRVVQATTSETGTTAASIKAWIQNAYDTWEDPPEYIVLVGDIDGDFSLPTFTESWSGYDGRGDHPYVELDGTDHLPDAFIGRLSAQTTGQLRLIVRKLVAYDTTPYLGRDWFSRACLVGDAESVSAITCKQVQQWVKDRLRRIGYTGIDTVWSAPFTIQMEASIRRGVGYFGYRGYYGMSGWDTGQIYASRNGRGMMPFAINLTCDTGTWYQGTSRSEAWLLAGTYPDSLKGGIGSIGTATTGTATRYNNCFYGGVAFGLFFQGDERLGAAQARGKLEMMINYGVNQPTTAATYCYWNSLMGDPATRMWTAFPQTLAVEHPAVLPLGSNQLAVRVTTPVGTPVAGAWVHAFREGQISAGAETDENGDALLVFDAASTGDVAITVTGRNLYAYRGTLAIQQQARYIGLDSFTIDDGVAPPASGNGDGQWNPGERIALAIALRNFGTQPVENVTLTLSCDDPDVGLHAPSSISFGTVAGGEVALADTVVVLYAQPAIANGKQVILELSAHAGADQWGSRLSIPVTAPDLLTESYALTGCGPTLDPGESADLVWTLRNDGDMDAAGPIQAHLSSEAYSVRVTDPDGVFPALAIGASGTNGGDPFQIAAPSDAFPGMLAPLRVALTFADGIRDTAQLVLPVGVAVATDPTGPDAHGYRIYGHQDTGYPEAPVYDWIDLRTVGTEVPLTDYAFEQDDVVVVDLPFPFTFYGQTFQRASICSNGWMAMGATYLTDSRNWYIPSAQGPANLIAVFWDDLYLHSAGKVYQWYDAVNHRYVVSWDNLYNNACYMTCESCQAILYDPAYYPTTTGDGVIVFQYQNVNQVDLEQMFCTVGIENEDHSIGLTYSYYNRQPSSGYWLLDGTALKITTGGPGAASAMTGLDLPPRLLLERSEPNPCGAAGATIHFTLGREGPVALRVYDADGRMVDTILSGTLPAGRHAIPWAARDQQGRQSPSGIYFYRLDAGKESASRKLLLIR